MRDNRVLADLFTANMSALGMTPEPPDVERLGSSDMGNVSQRLPTIHPSLPICERGVAGHSIEFRDAAVSDWADETTLVAATLVAQTAWDLLAEDRKSVV